jgi:Fe-S cluster biogenesis protein NfuA
MNELQYLKDLKTDIEAKIAEIEGSQSPVKWEPKGGDYYIDLAGNVHGSSSVKESRLFGIERETEEQAEHSAGWMRKFNRLLCWFDENAPEHEINIAFNTDSVDICFFALPEVIDNIRIQVRDGVVEL